MAWDENSDLCIAVHLNLVELDQITQNVHFEAAGTLKMQDLQFFNATASSESLAADAKQLAKSLDTMFVANYASAYKGSFDQTSAISAMVAIMIVAEKTVADLAAAIDQLYTIAA